MDRGLIAVIHDHDVDRVATREVLEEKGFQVVAGAHLEASLQYLRNHPPTAAIIGHTRRMDGFGLCRLVRIDPRLRGLPILIITSGGQRNRLAALESGADEAISMPIKQRELLVRLEAMLRRSGPRLLRDDIMQVGDLLIDEGRAKATFRGKTANLSVMEMKILKVLAGHSDRVIHRGEFLQTMGKAVSHDGRCIDVHMVSIRRKLGGDLIETVPRRGYRLRELGQPLIPVFPAPSAQ